MTDNDELDDYPRLCPKCKGRTVGKLQQENAALRAELSRLKVELAKKAFVSKEALREWKCVLGLAEAEAARADKAEEDIERLKAKLGRPGPLLGTG